MSRKLLFCSLGWVTVANQEDLVWPVTLVDPPDPKNAHVDKGDLFAITPTLLIRLINTGVQSVDTAIFLGNAKELVQLGGNKPRNETVLQLDLNPMPASRTTFHEAKPGYPLPVMQAGPIARIDAYLGQWSETMITPYPTLAAGEESLLGLSGLSSGCMVSCLVEVEEHMIPYRPKVLAAWLYGTGRSDRMRWRIFPWPDRLPPPPVTPD